MSSPLSLQQLRSPDGLTALGAALVQVAEDSLFAYAEPCGAEAFAAMLAERDAQEPWLSASVVFRGPVDGRACVRLPLALASDLCGAFSGTSADELDPQQVNDFTGELANMVCGLWLTRTHRSERFDLSAPVVTPCAAATAASAPDADAGVLELALNDVPIRIELHAAGDGGRG